jgi:hypothetical protein
MGLMRGRDERTPTNYTEPFKVELRSVDNDKDRTDKTTEADRADLRPFVWMIVFTFVVAILVWLGC